MCVERNPSTPPVRGHDLRAAGHVLHDELRQRSDLGANIGYYAIMEALIAGPDVKIYCMEPSPENFAILRKNISLNSLSHQIEVFNLGAADYSGDADFFLSHSSNLHTFFHKSYRGRDKSGEILTGDKITIPVTTVSEFIREKG